MLSNQIDQAERRAVLENDRRVRERERAQEERRGTFAQDQSLPRQASTYNQFALADAQTPLGRFSAISNAQVVGQGASYPPAGAHQHDPCGPEPALGFAIEQMFPDDPALVASADEPQAPDGPLAPSIATSPSAMSSGGPSSFSRTDDPATEETFPASGPARSRVSAGSSPLRRRKL